MSCVMPKLMKAWEAASSICSDWFRAGREFGISTGVLAGFPHMQVRIIWQKKKCISLCWGLTVFLILIQKQELFHVSNYARQSYFTSFFLLSLLFACAWPHRPFPLALTFSPLTGAPVFVLLPSSSLHPLYQSVGCAFVLLFGIKSDSLRDWMCVAMACCIWKAIHSAGTLEFNLKQDWCWQTSHPSLAKCFLYCTHQLLMEKGHTPLCNRDVRKNNTAK